MGPAGNEARSGTQSGVGGARRKLPGHAPSGLQGRDTGDAGDAGDAGKNDVPSAPSRLPASRWLAGAGLFVAAVAVLSLIGLLMTSGQEGAWRQVLRGGALSRGAAVRAPFVPMMRLRQWRDVLGEPPEAVKELDGKAATVIGIARHAAGGCVEGLWLVAEPRALSTREPPRHSSVWVDLAGALPEGARLEDVVPSRGHVRARGILRVGIAEIPGGGSAAYRLEIGTLSLRETHTPEHEHGDGCDHD